MGIRPSTLRTSVTLPEGFRLFSVGSEELPGRYADPYGVELVWVLGLERTGRFQGR